MKDELLQHALTRRSILTLVAVAMLAQAACTHHSPYYRRDQFNFPPWPNEADIDHRLLLTVDAGDAGEGGEPVLHLLWHYARRLPDRTTWPFLRVRSPSGGV